MVPIFSCYPSDTIFLRTKAICSKRMRRLISIRVNYMLSPGQTDRQLVASARKFNLRGDLRWVAKQTRKFYRKYTQIA